MRKCLKILTIVVDFLENIWNLSIAMKQSENRIESMILLRKIVSLNNVYINESNWLYTLQIYTVCKSRVEISHRLMEMFLILKRLGGQFDPSSKCFKNVSAKEIVNSWFFVPFNIMISHIIPEKFIQISQVV